MRPLVRTLPLLALVLAASPLAAQSITFGRPSPRVGDRLDQSVTVRMELDSTLRQAAEVVEQRHTDVVRTQQRKVTATALDGDRVTAAEVSFGESKAQRNGAAAADPIAGKSYLCWREDGGLRITTPDGQIPPMAEFELVARAMASLGTPSVLSGFLAGKTVTVGEALELPREAAQLALGFDPSMGEVAGFRLELQEIKEAEGASIGVFAAEVEAVGAGSQQMRLIIEGAVAIEGPRCRIVKADLTGPIAMSGLRGPTSQGFQLDARGKMTLAIASRYADAMR